MRTFRLVPDKTEIDFMRWRVPAIGASFAAILLSVVLLVYPGLNYGIDFEGGLMIEVETPGPADLATMRSSLTALDIGQVALQEFGSPNDVLVRIGTPEVPEGGDVDDAQKKAVDAVQAEIGRIVGGEVTYRRIEFVGPKVSGELVMDGLLAICITLVGVLLYIWFRFEWQYGAGAILALVHDVSLTVGLFALVGLEVNLSTVAAVLTIMGYSLNDTVVVFDRIRENLRRYKAMPMVELINLSINETLARTVMTSLTTLLALLCLFIFGGAVIRDFTFAMIWGVLVGTYSTVYIAAPLLVYFNLRGIGASKAAGDSEPEPVAG